MGVGSKNQPGSLSGMLAFGGLAGNLAIPGAAKPGFKPGGLSSLEMLSNPIKIGGATDQTSQPGEIITGTYHTYHSIDVLAPQLSQDLDLSLDALSELHVSKAKFFRSPSQPSKTVMCFLGKQANNITFVILYQ